MSFQNDGSFLRTLVETISGTGYPDGLAGEAIPLEGRVVAVVDAFDALVHERPYKPAWSVERAVEEIRDGAGSRYDPTVVDALVSRLDRLRSLLHSLEGPALSRDAGRGSGTPGSAGP